MARGWLKVEKRKSGKMWVLRFKTTRKTDGKRVEHKVPVGSVREFPSESSAWMEVQRQHLNVNTPDFRGAVKFSDLAEHYIQHELGDQSDAVDPKSHTTIGRYKRMLKTRLVPRLGQVRCARYRAVGDRAVVEGGEEGRAVGESHGGQDAATDVARLQERHAIRSDSSRRGIEPTSLCPLQNHERVRSPDSDTEAGFRFAYDAA